MSNKILVPVCVGFAVVSSCIAGAFFLAKGPKSQSPIIAGAPASAPVAGEVGINVAKSQDGLVESSTERASPIGAVIATGTAAGTAAALQSQSGVQNNARVPEPTFAATAAKGQPDTQVTLSPATVAPGVAPAAVTQAPRRSDVTAPPMPKNPAHAALAPAPIAPPTPTPASEAKLPQSAEAVVVTGQRPQQMARTDIDAIGRGNSLTIQLPKRRK